MKALTVIIEKTENNYSAYLAEVDGIVATGHNIDEIKANIVNAITALLEDCQEYGDEIPEELKGDYSLTFKMDVKSFLEFYTGIFTKSGLERLTGINQNNYGIMLLVVVTQDQSKLLKSKQRFTN